MNALRKIQSYLLFILMYLLGIYVFKILNRIKIIGKENLPRKTSILYISNHRTFIDSMLLGIGIIKWQELFFNQKHIPWNAPDLKNFYTNKTGVIFMKLLKNIPVNRNTMCRERFDSSIEKYCEILKEENLLLFPEGGRTKEGKEVMEEFKPGVAKTIFVATLRNPNFMVIPIYLDEGMEAIMPKRIGQKYLKIKSGKKGRMVIGKPINFQDICLSDKKSESEALRLIKEKGRNAILSLQ